jgi:hypothetical protein
MKRGVRNEGFRTLKEMRQKQDLVLAHKFVVGMDQPGRIATGDPSSLATKYVRTNTRKYSFGLRVTEPWNSWIQRPEIVPPGSSLKIRLKAKGKLAQLKIIGGK